MSGSWEENVGPQAQLPHMCKSSLFPNAWLRVSKKTEVLWNMVWLNEFIPFLWDLKPITWYNAGNFGCFKEMQT